MRSGTSSIASAPPTDSTTSSSPSAPWLLTSVMLVPASAAAASPTSPSLGCDAAAMSAVSAASVAWLSAPCGSALVGTGSEALVVSSWASSIGGSLSAAAAGASSAGSSAIGSAEMATGDPASAESSSVASASGAMCSDAAAMASPSVSLGACLPAAGAAVGLGLGGALGALVLGDQRLPVGDRDLVIVGMDFAEGEEAVAIAAVVDECGLQRRLDARHLGQINVAAKLLTACGLEVEFLDTMAAQNNHPGLFRMVRIDEHFVGH